MPHNITLYTNTNRTLVEFYLIIYILFVSISSYWILPDSFFLFSYFPVCRVFSLSCTVYLFYSVKFFSVLIFSILYSSFFIPVGCYFPSFPDSSRLYPSVPFYTFSLLICTFLLQSVLFHNKFLYFFALFLSSLFCCVIHFIMCNFIVFSSVPFL